MGDQKIYYISEQDVSDLVSDLRNKLSTECNVFLDNNTIPWLVEYLNSEQNLKKIDFSVIRKANQFYRGIDDLLAKHSAIPRLNKPGSPSNLHLIKPIATELANGTIASIKAIDPKIAAYEKLGPMPKDHLVDAGQVLHEFKEKMNALCEYTKHVSKTPNFIADNIENLLFKIKKRFKWGGKSSDKDISLVSAAFAKAIETKNETYIISDDDDICQITECLYNLFVCEQTGLTKKQLSMLLPIKITVSKTDTNKYTPVFTYTQAAAGRRYAIKSYLAIHCKMGTVDGSKAIQRSIEDTPVDTRKAAFKIIGHITQQYAKKEKEEKEKLAPVHQGTFKDQSTAGQFFPIPEEAKTEYPVKTIEEALAESRAAPADSEQAEATTRVLVRESPAEKIEPKLPDNKFANAIEIITDYARKAYESAAETPEKAKAMGALEELLACSPDENSKKAITSEIKSLNEKEKEYKQNMFKEIKAIIETTAQKIKDVTSQQEWYANPESISAIDRLSKELKEADEERKEIEQKIKSLS